MLGFISATNNGKRTLRQLYSAPERPVPKLFFRLIPLQAIADCWQPISPSPTKIRLWATGSRWTAK
jgi:hypothetical protein